MDAPERASYYRAWLGAFRRDSKIVKKLTEARSEYELVGFAPGCLMRNAENELGYVSFTNPTCFFMHSKLAGGAFIAPGGVERRFYQPEDGSLKGAMRSNPKASLSWVTDLGMLSGRSWREYLKDSVDELKSSKLTPERLAFESKNRHADQFKLAGAVVNLVYTRARGESQDLSVGKGLGRRAILYVHPFSGPGYSFDAPHLEALIVMRPGLRFNKSVLSEVQNVGLATDLEGVSG